MDIQLDFKYEKNKFALLNFFRYIGFKVHKLVMNHKLKI